MQTLTIDKKSNPEVAAMVADLEPGTKVLLHTAIKANDDQTLTLTLEEAETPEAETPEAEAKEEEPTGILPDGE